MFASDAHSGWLTMRLEGFLENRLEDFVGPRQVLGDHSKQLFLSLYWIIRISHVGAISSYFSCAHSQAHLTLHSLR